MTIRISACQVLRNSEGIHLNYVDLYLCSKCQARSAFAMYLVRVQQRLMSESGPSSQDDSDALNEQMVCHLQKENSRKIAI